MSAVIGNPNHSWRLVPLKDLGQWSGGGTPSKSKPEYWTEGSIPWVSPKDMKTARIADSEDHITTAAVSHSPAKPIAPGSVLVVTRSGILSHTLPVAVTDVPVTVNQDLKALTPHPGVLAEYVAWALRCFSRDILKTCSKQGTTVASIETAALQRFEIPLAPLEGQRSIVAEIDKQFSRLDEAVANLNRVKANLKRYKAAVLKAAVEGRLVETEAELARRQRRSYQDGDALLTRILAARSERSSTARNRRPSVTPENHPRPLPDGWTWATVDQLAVLVEYGSSAKTNQDSSGIPVLRMGNISDGELLFDDLKYLPAAHDEFPRLLLQDGDLLFNRTNSSELVGKTSVFRSSGAPCSFASYLIRVRLAEGIEPEFLAAYINSLHGRSWVRSVVTQQVGQANVNGTKLRGLTVPLPPTAEQRRIVAELERATSLMAEAESRSEKNSERAIGLRRAILSVVFNPNE